MYRSVRGIGVLIAVVAVAGSAVAGCGASSGGASGRHGQSATEIHLSRVKDYADLSSLAKDSSVIVRAVAGNSTSATANGAPTTTTEVSVEQVVHGDLAVKSLRIQQVGDRRTVVDNGAQVLEKGGEYLLFLNPFHMTPGDETGLYVMTGSLGEFRAKARGGSYAFQGGEESRLPSAISVQDVRDAVS